MEFVDIQNTASLRAYLTNFIRKAKFAWFILLFFCFIEYFFVKKYVNIWISNVPNILSKILTGCKHHTNSPSRDYAARQCIWIKTIQKWYEYIQWRLLVFHRLPFVYSHCLTIITSSISRKLFWKLKETIKKTNALAVTRHHRIELISIHVVYYLKPHVFN